MTAAPVINPIQCKSCAATFTSNDKLHAHIRRGQYFKPAGHTRIELAGNTPVIISQARPDCSKGLAFLSWHYATFAARLEENGAEHDLCGDTGCIMSLVDRKFLQKNLPGLQILQSNAEITVRGIGAYTHLCSEYTIVTIYVPGNIDGRRVLASITHQLHIVKNLQAEILVGMDILSPENAVIDIGRQKLTLPLCRNLQTDLTITLKLTRTTGRIVLANKLVTVLANSVMAVPIRLKKANTQLPPNQDFFFQPIPRGLHLGPQGRPRTHIVDINFTFVKVQNATNRPVIIPRKARLDKINDYKEENCHAINAEEAHLAAGASWPKQKISTTIDSLLMTEKHPTGFTAYGTQETRSKLFATAAKHQIWSKYGGFIKVPEDEWMPISLRPNVAPTGAKIYQLGPDDRKLVDKTFDLLHKQGKMEWSTDSTQYGSPVFVIWRTLPSGEQKGQEVTDI